nr:SDR family NAD(P)-dependent oxidoreductase [Piscinibacter gummiphilus]
MSSSDTPVVLITGGGAGIGRATARRFAAQGARVVITGRRQAALEAAAADHPAIGFIVADAGRAADAERTVQETVERHGRLDVLVNNAGAGAILPLADATAERIREIFDTTSWGRRCSRAPRCRTSSAAGATSSTSRAPSATRPRRRCPTTRAARQRSN